MEQPAALCIPKLSARQSESTLVLTPAAAKSLEMVLSIKERQNEQSSMRQIVQQHFRELQE
jgi:hypothetical protein